MKNEYTIKLDPEDLGVTGEAKTEEKCLWGMTKNEGTENVEIFPMNGSDCITIHGEEEAIFFTKCLMDNFRKKDFKGVST